MSAKIVIERLSSHVIRMTLTADVQISGLLDMQACHVDPAGGGGSEPGAVPADGVQADPLELLTVEQVAELLHVSRDKVYCLIRTGQLRSIKIGNLRRVAEVAETVDRRSVASPAQARRLLKAVRGQGPRGEHMEAFFGCLYYAALRPAEAVALREADCVLPARGWGRIDLAASQPRAGTQWTDNGASREERGLKHRASGETRSIPIPPVLARMLRAHIARYGPSPDGRLFRTARGGPLNDTGYGEVWQRARPKALTPAQQASPLARRPYDLRHAAVSLWLNAGVPATEVARRAGHGVAVLLKVYANCIDGQAGPANQRINDALSEAEPDGDSE